MGAPITEQDIEEAQQLLRAMGETEGLSDDEARAMAAAAVTERREEEDRRRQLLRDRDRTAVTSAHSR